MLVIGVGNAFRGDDAAGLMAVRALSQNRPEGAFVIESHGEGTDLMNAWKGWDKVILVDAMQGGLSPGVILRFMLPGNRLPLKRFSASTHAFGFAEVVELAKEFGEFPKLLVVFGIEGRKFALGNQMSQEVASQIPHLVRMIEEELLVLHAQEAA